MIAFGVALTCIAMPVVGTTFEPTPTAKPTVMPSVEPTQDPTIWRTTRRPTTGDPTTAPFPTMSTTPSPTTGAPTTEAPTTADSGNGCDVCAECGYEVGTCALLLSDGSLEECEHDASYFTSASICEGDDGVYCADCLTDEPTVMPTSQPTVMTGSPTTADSDNGCGVCVECGYEVGTCALLHPDDGTLEECGEDASYFTSASVCEDDEGVYCADCLTDGPTPQPTVMSTLQPTADPTTADSDNNGCGVCAECGYEVGTCALLLDDGSLEECEEDASHFTSASVCEADDGVYCANCLDSSSSDDPDPASNTAFSYPATIVFFFVTFISFIC